MRFAANHELQAGARDRAAPPLRSAAARAYCVVRAARAAGDVILRYHNQIDLLTIETKSTNDLVSEVDKTAEKAIINEIKKTFPKHSILGEESGETIGDNDFQWIIDPLDGTNNYLHGFPQYAVSIAFIEMIPLKRNFLLHQKVKALTLIWVFLKVENTQGLFQMRDYA